MDDKEEEEREDERRISVCKTGEEGMAADVEVGATIGEGDSVRTSIE